jgi:hypothetical protein
MKKIFVLLFLILAQTAVFAGELSGTQSKAQLSAQAATIEQLRTEIIELKIDDISENKQRDPRCDEERRDRPVTCVPNCKRRSSVDGTCFGYGPDFCAVNARCTPNCTRRSSVDGSCFGYGADICR